MNDLPRRVLRELVAEHGHELCEQRKWRMCRDLLLGRCPKQKQEVTLISEAQQCEVAEEILTRPHSADLSLLDDLVEKLKQQLDMSPDEARWAVEAWAIALGILHLPAAVASPEPTPEREPSSAAPALSMYDDPLRFFLGREYDLATKTVLDRPLMYESRDLLTHGVVVGMTGSGKTGLCISLLEEAALDNIPCIIVDPKGDLANLLLSFPDLPPEKFREWLNEDEARIKGLSADEYAEQLSDRWRSGLEKTGQSVERVKALHEAGDWRVYTPGSEAGLPLSILQNFAAPQGLRGEDLGQKVEATTTALLGLTGVTADPVQSREHVLISRIIMDAWSRGRDLTLGDLVNAVSEPPMDQIGNLPLDEFFPKRDRTRLAVSLNNILASPSFTTWLTGEPLDLGRLLKPDKGGKPRHLIFYIAHLDDAQRMFFVALLMEEILNWTRRQAGTTSLRAIVYFDEVAGYLPPYPANPPSKPPIITLFKQARAFGVGLLLATQNPIDLDYKALSNAGTWFVGKLQTERDKKRLLEGLEGVEAERGSLGDKSHLKKVIAALGNRVFLCHNVHRGQSLLFQTRWALSFLAGPMTRDQIARLMDPLRERVAVPMPKPQPVALPAVPEAVPATPTPIAAVVAEKTNAGPPELANVPQCHLPLANPVRPMDCVLVYEPRLLAFAEVVFPDRKRGVELRRQYRCLCSPPAPGAVVDWFKGETIGEAIAALPEDGARWAATPATLDAAKKLTSLKRQFAEYLYKNARVELLTSRTLGLVSEPNESRDAFQARCRRAAALEYEKEMATEKVRFASLFKALGFDLPEEAAAKQESSGMIESLFGAWSKMTTPDPEKHLKPKDQVKLANLRADWEKKKVDLAERWRQAGEECEEVTLAPRKTDVTVVQFALAWAPCWEVFGSGGLVDLKPAYRL